MSPTGIIWYGEGTPPGVYFLLAEDKSRRAAKKVVKLK